MQLNAGVAAFNTAGVTFLHTADWQLGKPFAGIDDAQKRALVQQERVNVIARIGAVARAQGAKFVVIAGDVFDSRRPTKATVSAACSALGAIGVPVLAIPGNHDHGGPGGLWEQPFFLQEQAQLAPNFRVLLTPEPVEIEGVMLFPCPLLHRHEAQDPTAWLRNIDFAPYGELPRVVLAHGSVQGFTSAGDDEDGGGAPNQIDLTRLPEGEFDYLALGDWHGMKQVGAKAWYAGTPELDRFPKTEDQAPGHVLAVTVRRGTAPEVTPVRTARLGWHRVAHSLSDDAALAPLEAHLETLLGGRAGQDLVNLELDGSLGLEAMTRLEQRLDAWAARLLRLRLTNRAIAAPTDAEIEALTLRVGDPLISRVARKLVEQSTLGGEDAAIARVALRELHAAVSA
jgi:DNA repair exonuclease SbcCD nuclease subunit